MANINFDRPTIIRRIPDLGMDVFMYKDAPGVFLSAHGTEVGIELARRAGFDVERWQKVKLRRERQAAAMDLIEKEMGDELDTGRKTLVEERAGFRIFKAGNSGQHWVEDPDGVSLTKGTPLTLELARMILNNLVPATDDGHPNPSEYEVQTAPQPERKGNRKVAP